MIGLSNRIQDDDIQIQSKDTISLLDPVTYTRIRIPVRSRQCRHAQCFDLYTYLEMNRNIPTWTCGICGVRVELKDLVVDCFFKEILQVITDEEVEYVEVDGEEYRPKANEVLAEPPRKKARRFTNTALPEPEDKVNDDSVVVDLTLDSD